MIGPATFFEELNFLGPQNARISFTKRHFAYFQSHCHLLLGAEHSDPNAEFACNAVRKPAPLHELFSHRPARRIQRLV